MSDIPLHWDDLDFDPDDDGDEEEEQDTEGRSHGAANQ